MSTRKPLKYNPNSGDIEQFRNDDEIPDSAIDTHDTDTRILLAKIVQILIDNDIDVEDDDLNDLTELLDD